MLYNLVDSLDNSLGTEPLAMSRQIIVPSGNIPDPRDNASSFKENRDFLSDRPQEQQKHGSKEIDDDEDVKVLVIRGRKIAIITASTKPAVEKLLMASIKVTLREDERDVSMSKI